MRKAHESSDADTPSFFLPASLLKIFMSVNSQQWAGVNSTVMVTCEAWSCRGLLECRPNPSTVWSVPVSLWSVFSCQRLMVPAVAQLCSRVPCCLSTSRGVSLIGLSLIALMLPSGIQQTQKWKKLWKDKDVGKEDKNGDCMLQMGSQ